MTKTIHESEMTFGEFDEDALFHIENSKIFNDIGSGIKTVEFILRNNNNSICFVEAKKSCPNAANKDESVDKQIKFEEYYSSITDKFNESFQIYLAAILNKFHDISEIGEALRNTPDMQKINLEFILIIKNADDVAWLAYPLAELKNRLLKMRKIWGIKIKVFNEDLANKDGLICHA